MLSSGAVYYCPIFGYSVIWCSIGFAMLFMCHSMKMRSFILLFIFDSKEEIWRRNHLPVTPCIVKWKPDRNYGITHCNITGVMYLKTEQFFCWSNGIDILFFLAKIHFKVLCACVWLTVIMSLTRRGEPPSGYFAKEIHICLEVVCISFQVWGFYMATYIFTYSWVIIS